MWAEGVWSARPSRPGRLLADNLRKCVAYTLSSSVAEVVPFLAYLTGHVPLALTPTLILCIDVGTNLWPAISLMCVGWQGPVGAVCCFKPACLVVAH